MIHPESRNTPEPFTAEKVAVGEALDLDVSNLSSEEVSEYNLIVQIAGMFSRYHEGKQQLLSPSKIRSIPVITAEYITKQKPAVGKEQSPQGILDVWNRYTPKNDGTRHPDQLFAVTADQFNWTDDSVRQAVNEIMNQPPGEQAEGNKRQPKSYGQMFLEAMRPGVDWQNAPQGAIDDAEFGILSNLVEQIKFTDTDNI